MKNDKTDEKSGWAMGGGVMLGLGSGLFVLKPLGALAFVGCLIGGIGVGLMLASILSKK